MKSLLEKYYKYKLNLIWARMKATSSYALRAEKIDYNSEGYYQTTHFQIQNLVSTFPDQFHTLCEIGSGDGNFIKYLSQNINGINNFIGSDIPNPRIKEAKKKIHEIEFHEMDILKFQNKFQEDGIIYLAMNVFDNIVPSEMKEFLLIASNNQTAITFCSRGLYNESDVDGIKRKTKPGYDHNYLKLINHYEYKIFDILQKKLKSYDESTPALMCTILSKHCDDKSPQKTII